MVAAIDTRPQAVTFVTTLRWLLTGKREPFMRFGGPVSVPTSWNELPALGGNWRRASPPRMPLRRTDPGCRGSPGGQAVSAMGRDGEICRSVGPVAQAASLVVFVLGLGIGIAVGLPVIACAALLGGARFRSGCAAIPTSADLAQPMTAQGSEHEELTDWLTAKVAGYLKVPSHTIDVDTPLADCGIDSVMAMTLCADLECEKDSPSTPPSSGTIPPSTPSPPT